MKFHVTQYPQHGVVMHEEREEKEEEQINRQFNRTAETDNGETAFHVLSNPQFLINFLTYLVTLLFSCIIDERKLLFLRKIRTSDNSVIRSFSILCTHDYGKIFSRYSIQNLYSSTAEFKRSSPKRNEATSN